MEPQNDAQALFKRIYMLEAEAERYLTAPQSAITVATYKVGFEGGGQQYLFFENKTTGNSNYAAASNVETSVSLLKAPPSPEQAPGPASIISTIKEAGEDTTLSGIIATPLWCLARPEIFTFREQRALLAVRGLWRAIDRQPWQRNEYNYSLRKNPQMARLSKQVVSSALPLVGEGALFLHQAAEPPTEEGRLYIERNQLTGDARHSDSRYTGWPLLRVRFDLRGTAYIYERTVDGEEETQKQPLDRRLRYQDFFDYTPQVTEEGLTPYPTLRGDVARFEAQERAAGKYAPQRWIVDLILSSLQRAAA